MTIDQALKNPEVRNTEIVENGVTSHSDSATEQGCAKQPISLPSYWDENMQLLADKVLESGILDDHDIKRVAGLIPYALTVRRNLALDGEGFCSYDVCDGKDAYVFYNDTCGIDVRYMSFTSVNPVQNHFIKQFLAAKYGPEILRSGLIQACELTDDTGLTKLKSIEHSIPELRVFDEFTSSMPFGLHHLTQPLNPYVSILAMPVRDRAFFAGAINHANGTDVPEGIANALTLGIIIDYAKHIGEVAKVDYYNASNSFWWQNPKAKYASQQIIDGCRIL
jgi:hypothetical protein